jgi:hypothetical protein
MASDENGHKSLCDSPIAPNAIARVNRVALAPTGAGRPHHCQFASIVHFVNRKAFRELSNIDWQKKNLHLFYISEGPKKNISAISFLLHFFINVKNIRRVFFQDVCLLYV